MSPTQAFNAYNQALYTMAKTRQVVMLYDGIIRYLKQARDAMVENRIQDRFNLLVKAGDIIMGLQSSLDFDKGEQVAQTLYDFYSSVDARILTLHRTQDVELCDQLVAELKEMRDIWDQIDRESASQQSIAAAPAPMPESTPEPTATNQLFPSNISA